PAGSGQGHPPGRSCPSCATAVNRRGRRCGNARSDAVERRRTNHELHEPWKPCCDLLRSTPRRCKAQACPPQAARCAYSRGSRRKRFRSLPHLAQGPRASLRRFGSARALKTWVAQTRPLIIHHISAAPPCKLGFWRGFREDRRRSVLEDVSTGRQRNRSQTTSSKG